MKEKNKEDVKKIIDVAPLVGAWIESRLGTSYNVIGSNVAPLVGAWIES